MRSMCAQDRPPPRQGPPEHGPRPPLEPGPEARGLDDVTAVCQVPSTEIPPKGPPVLWDPGTGDPRFGTRLRTPRHWPPSDCPVGMTAGDDAMSSTRPPADGSVPNSPDRSGTRVPDAEFSVSDGCYGARGRVPAASRGGVARGGLGPGTAADGEGCCAAWSAVGTRENRDSRMLSPGPPAGALG